MEPVAKDTTILTARRTTTFLASLLVALCSGTTYVYSVYGPQLGRRLRLSYTSQNLIGLGGYYGVCASGPLVGRLADSKGPRPGLALGFVLLLTGYLGTKAVYDSPKNSAEPAGGGTLLILILFQLFSGIGSEAGYCGALNVVMKSFPDRIRTTMTGMVISGFGLSAFLFSTIARTISPGNISDLLLILALVTPIPMVIGWFFIRICPYPGDIARTTSEPDDQAERNDPILTQNETSQLLIKNIPSESRSLDSVAMIRTVDFWILFWIMSLLAGSGVMWMNNVGLMARALELKHDSNSGDKELMKWQALHVSTLSIASCVGRVLIGVTADFASHRGMKRIQCFSIVAAFFLVSQVVGILAQDNQQLRHAVALVGISYGAVFGLSPIVVLELFGIAHVSENSSIVSLSVLVTGNIFSVMFGRVFDAHSTPTKHGMRCLEGARCYSASLYVTALACLCGLILARVAAGRDRTYK